jgi:Chaperone of endosialidase
LFIQKGNEMKTVSKSKSLIRFAIIAAAGSSACVSALAFAAAMEPGPKANSFLAATASPQRLSPVSLDSEALLQVDLNRTSIVDAIVAAWKQELPEAQMAALRTKLNALRADQLSAAKSTTSFDHVLETVNQSELNMLAISHKLDAAKTVDATDKSKAVGSVVDDYVYTPISPCRLLDTRGAFSPVFAGGAYTPNQIRTYQMTGNCGVPAGAGAVVTQITMITPSAAGDIELLPQGSSFGNTAAMVFQAGVYSSVSLVAKLNLGNGQFSTQIRGPGGNVAMDVTGYFMPPNRGGVGLRVIESNVPSEPNIINGASNNNMPAGSLHGATISGGASNGVASTGTFGWYSTVGGGAGNLVGTDAVGVYTAGGDYATVPGGQFNWAYGDHSFAAGRNSRAYHRTFVWNTYDTQNNLPNLTDAFRVQGRNGADFNFGATKQYYVAFNDLTAGQIISTSTGANLSTGGIWTNNSDRAAKENLRAINATAVLAKVVNLPITTWNYLKEGSDVRRMGPMAQDFHKAFSLGSNNTSIGTLDVSGVALAAIQGLNQKLVAESKAKDASLAKMQAELNAIKKKLGL